MKLLLECRGEQPDYHIFEAAQIFGDAGLEPVIRPFSGRDRIILEENGLAAGELPLEEAAASLGSRELVKHIYTELSAMTGYVSPWGCLTGVRPAKIVNRLFSEGYGEKEALAELTGFYLVSDEKARLAVTVAAGQKPFLDEQAADPSRIGIYIGIPFCPTRCLYCSFTSNPIEKYKKSTDTYLELLHAEMEAAAELVRRKELKIESVYIGGGTPTSLSEEQFDRFINDVSRLFAGPSPYLREFSVEAGRPDSITAGKLRSMRSGGVNRISVNPQTMNDETLVLIGRKHTPEDTVRAFGLARSCGFDNINADIICGLPGEDAEAFSRTLDRVSELRPESVTVHTLSVKRAAVLRNDSRRTMLDSGITGVMVSSAFSRLTSSGMRPYYMYRQKNMVGNHENVAYCLPGHESPYNVHIMEEDQTIIAAGAGAVSKRVSPGVVKRAFNVKSVEDYIARSTEMPERKNRLFEEADGNGA